MRNTSGKRSESGGGKRALRPDTTLSPVERPAEESYVREIPACCLRTLKATVARREEPARRLLSFECECGGSWRVTSSLDGRVLERFVVHGGPRVGGSSPAA